MRRVNVCGRMSVCQSVYNAVTFERIDLESLLFCVQVHHENLLANFVYQGHWVKDKVVSLLATDRGLSSRTVE